MTEDEVLAYLGEAGATLAFDTNTIFGRGGAVDPGIVLIDRINQINDLRKAEPPIRKVLPAVVLHEKLRQMRQAMLQRGRAFDPAQPENFMVSKKLTVEAFDRVHAERVAEHLATLYPATGSWRAFKKRRCLECVGLSPTHADATGDGHRCGATVDWLIAAQADQNGYLLVTNDLGPEFASVARRAEVAVIQAAADRLFASLATTS